MDFFYIDSLKQLEEGTFHVMEPVRGSEKADPLQQPVIVPGSVFGRDGSRYGYGKGYYDRFFAKYPRLRRYAVCYEHQLEETLPIDPHDVGREYEADVIRINSQSGKGGVAYIMEQKYGISMPKKMREDFGYCVKDVSDHKHKELLGDEIYQIFHDNYVNVSTPYNLIDFSLKKEVDGTRSGYVELEINGKPTVFKAKGNGRLDAISNAIQENTDVRYTDLTYSEHALEIGSTSRAMAYIGVTGTDGKITWGAGMDTDIITASVMALFSAINRMVRNKN